MYTVKQARLLAGLTQADVAARMNVDVGTYRRIEISPEKTSIENAVKFCKIVGQKIDNIFFASDSTESRITVPTASTESALISTNIT